MRNDNFHEIDTALEGKQFDSIIVLPKNTEKYEFDFRNERIVTEYPEHHQKEIMRNIFAYKMASKYLTTSGVVILSGS